MSLYALDGCNEAFLMQDIVLPGLPSPQPSGNSPFILTEKWVEKVTPLCCCCCNWIDLGQNQNLKQILVVSEEEKAISESKARVVELLINMV